MSPAANVAETTDVQEPAKDLAQMSKPRGSNPFKIINDDGDGDTLEAAKVGSRGVLVRTRCAQGVAMTFVPNGGIQIGPGGNRIS